MNTQPFCRQATKIGGKEACSLLQAQSVRGTNLSTRPQILMCPGPQIDTRQLCLELKAPGVYIDCMVKQYLHNNYYNIHNGSLIGLFFIGIASYVRIYPIAIGYFTRADDASIFIDGGPTFEVGDMVTIRCYYTGDNVAFNQPPHFNINGVMKSNLSEYQQKYTSGYEYGAAAANYTLTLPVASAKYNGTSYQCIAINVFNETDLYPSGIVTLIVTGKHGYIKYLQYNYVCT